MQYDSYEQFVRASLARTGVTPRVKAASQAILETFEQKEYSNEEVFATLMLSLMAAVPTEHGDAREVALDALTGVGTIVGDFIEDADTAAEQVTEESGIEMVDIAPGIKLGSGRIGAPRGATLDDLRAQIAADLGVPVDQIQILDAQNIATGERITA